MGNNEKVEVRAYRGYYVNMDNIIPVIVQLLRDAEDRRGRIIILSGGENAKLDGAVISLLAIKEALYHLEVFGDLIPQTVPCHSCGAVGNEEHGCGDPEKKEETHDSGPVSPISTVTEAQKSDRPI